MAEIEFKPKETDTSNGRNGRAFDPMSYDGITPRCCCGYELLKEDEKTFRCSGGNHRYRMDAGEVELDKFGNLLLKKPEEFLTPAEE